MILVYFLAKSLFVFFIIVTNIAVSSLFSFTAASISSSSHRQLSEISSSQYPVSSSSWSEILALEINSSLDRDLVASRKFAPTEVPDLNICFPSIWATLFLGSLLLAGLSVTQSLWSVFSNLPFLPFALCLLLSDL